MLYLNAVFLKVSSETWNCDVFVSLRKLRATFGTCSQSNLRYSCRSPQSTIIFFKRYIAGQPHWNSSVDVIHVN